MLKPYKNKNGEINNNILIFESTIYQANNEVWDFSQLYRDLEQDCEELKRIISSDTLGRHHPLQHILNSTSGNYVSPTAMKGFELCPAGYVIAKLYDEEKGTFTSVGSSFHEIMEIFYNLPKEERTKEKIFYIANEVIEKDEQEGRAKDDILWYVEEAYNSPDYEDCDKQIDHTKIDCANEVFIKPVINPLGVNLGVPIYTLIDRIDITDKGINVIDYKTGKGDPVEYNLGINGYLPQMIFYKWAVEAEYGQEINKAFLSLPGASREYKWVEMEVNSLVNQSKVVEQVHYHLEHIRKCRDSKLFEATCKRYCSSCPQHENCISWLKDKGLDTNKVINEIPINIKVEKKVYNPNIDKSSDNTTSSDDTSI